MGITHAIVAHCQEFEVWFGRGKFHETNLEMTMVCDQSTTQWSDDLTMGEQHNSPRKERARARWVGRERLILPYNNQTNTARNIYMYHGSHVSCSWLFSLGSPQNYTVMPSCHKQVFQTQQSSEFSKKVNNQLYQQKQRSTKRIAQQFTQNPCTPCEHVESFKLTIHKPHISLEYRVRACADKHASRTAYTNR